MVNTDGMHLTLEVPLRGNDGSEVEYARMEVDGMPVWVYKLRVKSTEIKNGETLQLELEVVEHGPKKA